MQQEGFTMNTFGGFMAVIFWSISIPLSRSLTEKVGMFNTAGLACLIGGMIPVVYYMAVYRSQFWTLTRFSPRYLLVCGTTFVFYMLCLYGAIGTASGREQIVEVGLINYLWPTLILVFSIPILKNRGSPWLIFGIVVSLSGIFLATVSMNREILSIRSLLVNVKDNSVPYLFALGAAVLWSIYSNLASKMADLSNKLTVPLLLIVSGMTLEILSIGLNEKAVWNPTARIELLILALFPCVFAYVLWDAAMRKGNMILVTSFSYLTPLFSIIVTGLYLGVNLVTGVWIACALVIGGAVVCNFSIRRKCYEHNIQQ
jgi:drug/metabolite transporter (DMT)-like permease